MKTKLTLDQQPADFIRRQPPEPRRMLRESLQDIADGKTFPEPLTDELEGFYKVRVSGYRMLLKAEASESGPAFDVVFAERRRVVYELFKQMLGLE